jgi:hypothetical protein
MPSKTKTASKEREGRSERGRRQELHPEIKEKDQQKREWG